MYNEIICPYCGYEFSDSITYEDCDEDLIECEECGKKFYVTSNIEVTYSTKVAKYGKCRCCGVEDVFLENMKTNIGEEKVDIDDYCSNCIRIAIDNTLKGISTIDKKE